MIHPPILSWNRHPPRDTIEYRDTLLRHQKKTGIKTDTALVGMKTGDQPSNKIRRSELPKYRYLGNKDHAYNNNHF